MYPWFPGGGGFGAPYGQPLYLQQMNYTAAVQAARDYEKQLKKQTEEMNADKKKRLEEENRRLQEEIEAIKFKISEAEFNRMLIEQLNPPGETSFLYADGKVFATVESHPLGETKCYAHTNWEPEKAEKAESVRTEEEPICTEPWLALFITFLLGVVMFIAFYLLGKKGGPENDWLSKIGIWSCVFAWIESKRRRK